jgi:hypothetical protein
MLLNEFIRDHCGISDVYLRTDQKGTAAFAVGPSSRQPLRLSHTLPGHVPVRVACTPVYRKSQENAL